jgi:hypothetical protein
MSINSMSIKSGTKGSNSCGINNISNGIGFSPKSVLPVNIGGVATNFGISFPS